MLQQLVGLLGAGGIASAVTFLLTLPQRRAVLAAQASKTEDEGSKAASEGAASLVQAVGAAAAALVSEAASSLPTLQAEVARQGEALAAERRRNDRLEQELDNGRKHRERLELELATERRERERLERQVADDRRERDELVEVHTAWDLRVTAALERLGEHVEPAPPLRPRRRVLTMPTPDAPDGA